MRRGSKESALRPNPDKHKLRLNTYRPSSFSRYRFTEPKISNIPEAKLIHSLDNGYDKCFCVCLFKEPAYSTLFQSKLFSSKYLDSVEEIRKYLAENKFDLIIVTDFAMSERAVEMGIGSVYMVDEEPPYPFYQHIYRYLPVLFSNKSQFHFRGLDNLTVPWFELEHFKMLENYDVIRSPYIRPVTKDYISVKGSCSVANDGIRSLRSALKRHNKSRPEDLRMCWHSDETFLSEWFDRDSDKLRTISIVDRSLPTQFWSQVKQNSNKGLPSAIIRL